MLKLFIFILLTIPITTVAQPYILVLGTAQDGGYPHIGCKRSCCNLAWGNNKKINVVSLALVDPENKKWWLFEATPDIKEQLQLLRLLLEELITIYRKASSLHMHILGTTQG